MMKDNGNPKSLLEQVDKVDNFTRQLRKMESKMKAGQFIQCHRECCRIIAEMEREKRRLIARGDNSRGNGEE